MTICNEQSRFNHNILLVVDLLIIHVCFRFTAYIEHGGWQLRGYYPMFFAVFALLWLIVDNQTTDPNLLERVPTYAGKFWHRVKVLLVHVVVLTSGVVLLQIRVIPLSYLVLLYSLIGAAVISARLIIAYSHRLYLYHWARPHSRFVIVGTSRSGCDLHNFIESRDPLGNKFLGFFTDSQATEEVRHLVQGNLRQLKEYCVRMRVDHIYFALPMDRTQLIEEIAGFADDHFIILCIVPDFEGTLHKNVVLHQYDHGLILTVRSQPLASRSNQVVKRVFDLAFSSIVILFIFPWLFPILVLLIKLDSSGPAFFNQMRPGKRNELFPCFKFRTMHANLKEAELQACKGDARITRIGRYLRASSLDELPQFFNVWLGHMSVVGPRPNMVSQLRDYSQRIRTYSLRHAVTPGITGHAQVSGYRGETREEGAMEKRVKLDLEYLENWSLFFDLKIIGKTVWNMLTGEKNAY
ncbi:exopolysaccharide biosynthesis polyprenyl glycosylphosphotransferase [Hymenobacter terrestris]|uniref:Exopolysaccharide biosynthesis polyprenyl glycosylphosphotransferase n=1 Tax=Hymenobacter terrestris TaxID=2748310 RepID=A0ABX2Q8N3_9BACT|nr:exopolysaccharide biosynthesis polyprenyl glycosylphosphotransferase [Hymenobacter terrestris]NVO86097.1 exopolysaccharide biosynthesis polyprenyl glycosylphosphotransferase [Hymenobacter terrestris]